MKFDLLSDINTYKGYEFSDIIQIVKNQLEISTSIALTKAMQLTDVKKAYEKALGHLSRKGFGKFYDIRNSGDDAAYSSLDAIIRLNKDLETLQAEDAENALNLLWDKLRDNNGSEGDIKIYDMNLLTSAISILMTNIISKGFSIDKIYGEGFSPEKYMSDAATPSQMKDRVIYLYKKRIEFEKSKKDTKTHDVATAAKEYIDNNYSDSALSISDISGELCLNQTYLRKMFKSEMDMTLTEYITGVRMQKAKALLTTTDQKLTAIAESVGYNDVSYFSNVFKKFYGVSPRSMRKET